MIGEELVLDDVKLPGAILPRQEEYLSSDGSCRRIQSSTQPQTLQQVRPVPKALPYVFIWAVGVEREIANSSSFMSVPTSANSGVLR